MWKKTNAIVLNATSIVDLKSEVLKIKEDTKKRRADLPQHTEDDPIGTGAAPAVKKVKLKKAPASTSTWNSKKGQKGTKKELTERERMEIMERKSRLYEKLSKGSLDLDPAEAEDVMVDFERKYLMNDLSDDDGEDFAGANEMVEITDEFGRTRKVPRWEAEKHLGVHVNVESDYKEYDETDKRGYHMYPPVAMQYAKKHIDITDAEKEKVVRDEEAEDEFQTLLMKSSKIDRFNHRKELTRPMGVGFYQFSDEEKARQEQMDSLKQIRSEVFPSLFPYFRISGEC
jgi:hypothetical protein